MDLAAEKRALRRRARARAAPSETAALQLAAAAARAAEAQPRFAAAERIVLYASLPDEIPTHPLAASLSERALLLPRRRSGGGLDFCAVSDWEQLVRGSMGTLEPRPEVVAERLSAADLVFVPGLAFDRCGGRLGRGGGDYDRALSLLAGDMPFVCGLAYACRLIEHVPMGPLDVRVDAFLSEAGWLDTAGEVGG